MALPQRSQPHARLVDASPRYVYEAGASARAGISFDCPIHEHCRIAVPFSNPPEGPTGPWAAGMHGGWHREGEDFATMSLSPSIHIMGEPAGCEWHGFVRHGQFETCGDSK